MYIYITCTTGISFHEPKAFFAFLFFARLKSKWQGSNASAKLLGPGYATFSNNLTFNVA